MEHNFDVPSKVTLSLILIFHGGSFEVFFTIRVIWAMRRDNFLWKNNTSLKYGLKY